MLILTQTLLANMILVKLYILKSHRVTESQNHRHLALNVILGNTETCREMQEHAETFRGINGHAGNTWELREIHGNTRE